MGQNPSCMSASRNKIVCREIHSAKYCDRSASLIQILHCSYCNLVLLLYLCKQLVSSVQLLGTKLLRQIGAYGKQIVKAEV